jgi:general stress protein 26
MPKTLADIAEAMRDIDFCTLATHTRGGAIGARPMSNNRTVDFDGTTRFFTYEDRLMVSDVAADPKVGVTYQGSAGLKGILGAPGQFIHLEGNATIIRDRETFAEHWDKSLDRWFPQGPDTPGTVLLEVTATRIHYWDGEEEGEVPVSA